MASRRTKVVLLPGLDGTGSLFKRFIAVAPPHVQLIPMALPLEPLNYDELADTVAQRLSGGEPLVLIAESFSGPLALALTRRRPVAALVFCNSFVDSPRSQALRPLVVAALFARPLPRFLLRRLMTGGTTDQTLLDEVAAAVASVPGSVLASRLRLVLSTNQAIAFASCALPTLYVRGTEDRLVPDSAFHRMAAIRPMAIARVRGPHLLLQANPVGAWKAISPFLASLPAV